MAILNKIQTLILSTLITGVTVTAFSDSSEMLTLSNYSVNPTCDSTEEGFCSHTIVNLYCNKDIDSMPPFGQHRNKTSDERWTSLHAEEGNAEGDSYSLIDEQFNDGNGTLKCIVQGIYEDYNMKSDMGYVYNYVDLGWFKFTITDGVVTRSKNKLSFDNEIFPLSQDNYKFPNPGQLSTFIQYINPVS